MPPRQFTTALLLLTGLLASTGTVQLAAQETLPETLFDEVYDSPVMPEQNDRLIAAPDPSQHAGLLGKIWMQQRYVHFRIDDPDVRQIDKSPQGFDSRINLPLMTLDLPIPLDFDVFGAYTNAGLKGSAGTGPPLDLHISMNGKSEVYSVGTTIYPTMSEKWRPFVQIGADFVRTDTDITLTDGVDTFADNIVDHETELLLNAGFEFDLLDYLGYRMTVDIETDSGIEDSAISNDLILWPHEHLYLRGGMVTPMNGDGMGFIVGGGLAF